MRRLALLFVINTLSYGFAVEAPRNTFAVVGQTAFFKCRAPNGSKVRDDWSFKRSNATEVIITSNQPTRYRVDNDQSGFSVLSINDVTMEEGGNYACRLENNTTAEVTPYGAELIVLDTNSKCELKQSDKTISGVIMKGNYLEILCNFSFAGNMVPVIRWFRNSHRISLPLLNQADNYSDGIHWLHFNTTLQLNASDNGMVLGYEVDFERSNTSYTTESTQTIVIQATNALFNVFRWNFTAVVWHMPRNIRIESVKKIYDFGDRIECSADGNPPPDFTWSCDNGTKREGSVLTLDADAFHANVDYACQCIAISSIFSTNVSETVDIRIAPRIAHETEWTNIIICVIAGILAGVIFAILIALYFKGFLCCSANKDPDIVQHREDRSKTRTAADTLNKSTAVYAEVRKPLTGPTALKTEKRMPKATAKGTTYKTDQDDAVIYLDLKGGRSKVGKSPPAALPTMSQTAMFNQSEYAAIDHGDQNDTVIYLDLKGGRSKLGKPPPVALPTMSQTAMFNQSEYASIDHALQPPPLKKRNN